MPDFDWSLIGRERFKDVYANVKGHLRSGKCVYVAYVNDRVIITESITQRAKRIKFHQLCGVYTDGRLSEQRLYDDITTTIEQQNERKEKAGGLLVTPLG